MSKQKVYIAGKVTGLSRLEVVAKFTKAESEWKQKGYEVINPIKIVKSKKTEWEDAMKICIKEMMNCDTVYALKDWNKSRGAKVEIMLALSLNIKVSFENLSESNFTNAQLNYLKEL